MLKSFGRLFGSDRRLGLGRARFRKLSAAAATRAAIVVALSAGLPGSLAAQNTPPKDFWFCIGGDRDQVVYSAVFRRPFSYMNASTISADWRQSRAFTYLSRDSSLSSQCVGAGQDPAIAKTRRDQAVAEMQRATGAGSAIDTEWSP